MMDHLKRYLAGADIQYMERVFSSSEGVRGLRDDPFVCKNNLFSMTYDTNN